MTADHALLRTYFHKLLGTPPADYFCFDMETTGFRAEDDLVVELGNCVVKHGKAQHYETHVLDWTHKDVSEYVPLDWLKWKLKRCAKQMKAAGRVSHMTIERMQAEGDSPIAVLSAYVQMFRNWRAVEKYFLGHNLVQFDAKRFAQATEEWLGEAWVFDSDAVIDTAAIEKAIQTGMDPNDDETCAGYMKRVLSRPAPGVSWALEPWCVEKYQLTKKYPGLNMNDAHSAGFDAMLVHLLFEEFRELANGSSARIRRHTQQKA